MAKVIISTMLQVGTVLHGTYRIESYLSSGGFGNTYLAKNIEFGETYAIKEFFVKGVCQRDGNSTTISVSNTENSDSFAQQKEKFKKEARRLRSLSNPHIVKVYDLFEENGTAYYVMDYVDGENLSTRLNRTNSPLSESVVRNYLSQILDGLEAIHAAGIWHLDIKPANIMVDSHNVVKLIDFGASKQQSVAGGATMSTGISYTNGYAPSEQMAQSYDKFGPWTDFYALGATLYKLLTNQNPPSVTDLSEDESEDKHIVLPMANVSAEMKKLVVWMMQVNRLKRPKNVGEIKGFLENRTEFKNSNNAVLSDSTKEMEDCDEETVWLDNKGDKPNEVEQKNNPEETGSDATSKSKARIIVIFLLIVMVAGCFVFVTRKCGSTKKAINTTLKSPDTTFDKTQQMPSAETEVRKYEGKVYDVVEQMPSYPGGQKALMSYLGNNINYPVVAQENGEQGRVVVSFIVESDGSISNVNVMRSVTPSLDCEALRVVKAMPKWKPGKQNGQYVRVKCTVPIVFRLQ